MKKLKLCILLTLLACTLCACDTSTTPTKSPIILDEEPIPTPITDKESSQSTEESKTTDIEEIETNEPEDDTLPPNPGMARSRLTNEWVDEEVAYTRPIAVMIPNEKAAVPHYNLSKASILYEANVEGRMTRLLGIYEGWDSLDKIGNIRSLRLYYAFWALEWDAYIVHFGGPYFIDDLIAQPTTQNVNGNLGGADSLAFFRSDDREAPHNAYATGAGLFNAITKKNYSLAYRGLADDRHYQFTTKAEPNTLEQYGTAAKDATYIDMSGCYPLTRCYFEYNEDDGQYYRFQHLSGSSDGPHMDAATGEQLKFKNILVQNTKHEEIIEGYLALQCHDTTRDGWYFTNGKGIHVTWEKTSDFGATRYYDDSGNEIVMNAGKTMVCIVEEGDTFSYR
ncbi:MAG: DUF3048 domain-containing protein [Lachnospiraceae bacterium]|nr:DUF3048 domain-containing protein [Lachnospiraceae bacterium]